MKLNTFLQTSGCQKLIEVDDECKIPTFYEKCMAAEVGAGGLSEEWKHICWTWYEAHDFIHLQRKLSTLHPVACPVVGVRDNRPYGLHHWAPWPSACGCVWPMAGNEQRQETEGWEVRVFTPSLPIC
uniref:40S ribosomal protein S6 n=1 Tax=Equus asinus asinus TaxID=83772 RepID=A0A8C4MPE2_EQUAS